MIADLVDDLGAALTILLVESDPSARVLAIPTLGRTSSNVLRASSGREALRYMAEAKVDIVLADDRLPDMKGSLLLAQVRRLAPDTIRILAARDVSAETAIEAINVAEVFRFLRRPCSEHELLACLQDAAVERERRRLGPRVKTESALLRDLRMHDLAQAFARGLDRLYVAVQPVVRGSTDAVFGYEALVRTDEALFPDATAFLEAAERLGRVRDLERSIFTRLGELLLAMPEAATLLVNLHPRSLAEGDLPADLSPLVPFASRVIFEITERASLHGMEGARDRVDRLRQLGFRVAVDDLGAGYAGLTSIALLQPDFVKIDMELVRGVDVSTTRAILIASVVALCGQLGIGVIAEGVETSAEKARLLELGCDLLQGYYFAPPARHLSGSAWPSMGLRAEEPPAESAG